MTQKNTKKFINEIYSKPSKKNYATNKTDVYRIDYIWSWDILLGKNSFENILISSKRKPNLIQSDRGKQFCNNIFPDFLNKNNIKIYSRNSSFGAVFAERFIKNLKNLLKKPVSEKGDRNWIDVLPTITKQ